MYSTHIYLQVYIHTYVRNYVLKYMYILTCMYSLNRDFTHTHTEKYDVSVHEIM